MLHLVWNGLCSFLHSQSHLGPESSKYNVFVLLLQVLIEYNVISQWNALCHKSADCIPELYCVLSKRSRQQWKTTVTPWQFLTLSKRPAFISCSCRSYKILGPFLFPVCLLLLACPTVHKAQTKTPPDLLCENLKFNDNTLTHTYVISRQDKHTNTAIFCIIFTINKKT